MQMPALINSRAPPTQTLILTAISRMVPDARPVPQNARPAFCTQPHGERLRLPAGLPALRIDEESLLPEDAAIMPAAAARKPLLR
jgi:hypothetical protein